MPTSSAIIPQPSAFISPDKSRRLTAAVYQCCCQPRAAAAPLVATVAGEGLPGRSSPTPPSSSHPCVGREGTERSGSQQRCRAAAALGRIEASPAKRGELCPHHGENRTCTCVSTPLRSAVAKHCSPKAVLAGSSTAQSCVPTSSAGLPALTATSPQPGAALAAIRSKAKTHSRIRAWGEVGGS